MAKLTNLFIDIGGVIMTNGWDRVARAKAAQDFGLNQQEFDKRHRLFYNIYESGKISLDDYLKESVFWEPRDFSLNDFKKFMYAQSKPFPDMIDYFTDLKKRYDLRVSAISNEGRELADYRIKLANLTDFIDDFFISGYVGYQKPDPHIYQIALDVTQADLSKSFYVDDRAELIVAAAKEGLRGVQQTSLEKTSRALNGLL